VAPGVTLRSFDRYGPDAYTGTPTWLQADSLTVDLTKGTKVGYLFPGRVAAGEPISVQANRAGAVAAVNGDFFDINHSTAPLGTGIRSGTLIQSRDIRDSTWHSSVATVTPDGAGSIGEVFFEGTIVVPGASTVPLAGINQQAHPVRRWHRGVHAPVGHALPLSRDPRRRTRHRGRGRGRDGDGSPATSGRG
jgi:hypothetical protein